MKVYIVRAVLLAAILATFLPGVARAQESANCDWGFYCTVYAQYTGGQITGYMQVYDDDGDWYLSVSASMSSPSGVEEPWSCSSDEGYGDVISNCNYTPFANGIWELGGNFYYQVETWWEWAGDAYYDAAVSQPPSGEDTVAGPSACCGNDGFQFTVTLQPTYFNFDAYQTVENVGPANDECYTTYHATAGPAQTASAPAFYTHGNIYYDTIASPYSYVAAYQPLVIANNTSCNWTAFQIMSYNGSQYTSRYLWQTIGPGRQVTTCRTVCAEENYYY